MKVNGTCIVQSKRTKENTQTEILNQMIKVCSEVKLNCLKSNVCGFQTSNAHMLVIIARHIQATL
jgi:hypothetical protein